MIRQAVLRDAPAIVGMARRFHAAAETGWPFDDAMVREAVRQAIADAAGGQCLVLDERGQLAGFMAASFYPGRFFSRPIAMIWALWVEPKARSLATVHSMLQAFEIEARRRGCIAADVTAQDGDDGLGLLYQRLGYSARETHYAKAL